MMAVHDSGSQPSPLQWDPKVKKELHIAPMIDISNHEFRQLLRILSKKCVLWSEMVVGETLVHTNNVDEHLAFDKETRPVICQIGGNSPDQVGKGTKLIEEYGYCEINLNVDCPSNRVSTKREFGASLMKKVETTYAVVESMKNNSKGIPISIKTRIGVDEFDDLNFIVDFIKRVTPVCTKYVIHARKCLLQGLSPAQNRIVPPLNYPRVYELCRLFPHCEFIINGGIPGLLAAKSIVYGKTHEDVSRCHLSMGGGNTDETGERRITNKHAVPCRLCNASNGSCTAPPDDAPPNLRGCMLGRAAMDNVAMFHDVDRFFYGEEANPCKSRREVLEKYCEYLERVYARRCGDSDERITFKITSPQFVHERDFCQVCENYRSGVHDDRSSTTECNATQDLFAISNPTLDNTGSKENRLKRHQRKSPGTKISSRVIDRALRPVLSIFFGLPGSRSFRRACDKLSRDLEVRNCGPAFILFKAMEIVPAASLDQDFVKTEDLTNVVSHVAPRANLQ